MVTQLIDRIAQVRKDSRRRIDVPEWAKEGEPVPALYFGVLTTADVNAVRGRMLADDGLDPAKNKEEERIALLIQKAEFEDGTQAFQWGHRAHLIENCEWAVLNRLYAFMYRSTFTTVEDARKKSEPTVSSDSDSPSVST